MRTSRTARLGVDASQLDQFITLEKPQSTPDGQGGYIETLQPLTPGIDWAAVEPATSASDELPVAGTTVASFTHHVRLRYRPDVDLATQLTFVDWGLKTHRLFVRSIQNPQAQSELLVLWCEEGPG